VLLWADVIFSLVAISAVVVYFYILMIKTY
jgi:hypothetical protein